MIKVMFCLAVLIAGVAAHEHQLYAANGGVVYDNFYPLAGGREDVVHVGMTNAGDPQAGALVADPPMLALTVILGDDQEDVTPPDDVSRSLWEKGFKDMVDNVVFHSATQYDAQLFIYGGLDNDNNVLSTFQKFDLENHRWYDITELPDTTCANCTTPPPLFGHCSVTDGERLFLLGGQSSTSVWTAPTDIYWIELQNLESGWRSRSSTGVGALPVAVSDALDRIYTTCFEFSEGANEIAVVAGGFKPIPGASEQINEFNLDGLMNAVTLIVSNTAIFPSGRFGMTGDLWTPSISNGPPDAATCRAHTFVFAGGFVNDSTAANSTSGGNIFFYDYLARSFMTGCVDDATSFDDFPTRADAEYFDWPVPRGFATGFEFHSQFYLMTGATTPNDAPFVPDNVWDDDIALLPDCGIYNFQAISPTNSTNVDLRWNFINGTTFSTQSTIAIDNEKFIRWPLGHNDGARNFLSHYGSGTV